MLLTILILLTSQCAVYYVISCFCINALSTAFSILVLYVHHCESDNSTLLRWMTYLFIRNPGRGNKVSSEPNWESSFVDKTKILSSATDELGLDTSQSGTETILRNKTIGESKLRVRCDQQLMSESGHERANHERASRERACHERANRNIFQINQLYICSVIDSVAGFTLIIELT